MDMDDDLWFLLVALNVEIEIYTLAIRHGIPCEAERARVVQRLRELGT